MPSEAPYQDHTSPGTSQQEHRVLLPPRDEGHPIDSKREENLEECYQAPEKTRACEPPPPPQQTIVFRAISTAVPQTEQIRRRSCDLKRLNSCRSSRTLILRDQKKKRLHATSSARGLPRRHLPVHHDHFDRVSNHRSSKGSENPCHLHTERSTKASRQSHPLPVGMSPSNAATSGSQKRSCVETASDRPVPRPDRTSVITDRFDADSAEEKLPVNGSANDVGSKIAPLTVPVKSKELQWSNWQRGPVDVMKSPVPGIKRSVTPDETAQKFKANTKMEQVRLEKQRSHHSNRGQRTPGVMRRNHPSHTWTKVDQQQLQLTLPSTSHAEKVHKMKRRGEAELGVSHRRKLPPRASSRRTCRQSSDYSPSSTSQSSASAKSSELSSGTGRVASRGGSTVSSRTVPGQSRRPVKHSTPVTDKHPHRRALSRHQQSVVSPRAAVGTTRSNHPKDTKTQEGRLRRIRNKLSIIFHHHHHHHLHHGQVGGDDSSEDGDGVERPHRSSREHLWNIIRRTSETDHVGRTGRGAPTQHRRGHLYAFLEGVIRHVLILARRKRKAVLPNKPVRAGQANRVRWWQRLRRRGRRARLAMPRLRLGFGRATRKT
ncbi:hypothetical protein MUK42_24099 [Musa troglodytarum]|uniref:Uncharacterized protein n=1 Tax=Musa troglodytarum TaxID=320322 RepID=A0A9E7EFU0_9LILI|nr:hypothetical protein MUK42_24099 [Musa troglodytarum]